MATSTRKVLVALAVIVAAVASACGGDAGTETAAPADRSTTDSAFIDPVAQHCTATGDAPRSGDQMMVVPLPDTPVDLTVTDTSVEVTIHSGPTWEWTVPGYEYAAHVWFHETGDVARYLRIYADTGGPAPTVAVVDAEMDYVAPATVQVDPNNRSFTLTAARAPFEMFDTPDDLAIIASISLYGTEASSGMFVTQQSSCGTDDWAPGHHTASRPTTTAPTVTTAPEPVPVPAPVPADTTSTLAPDVPPPSGVGAYSGHAYCDNATLDDFCVEFGHYWLTGEPAPGYTCDGPTDGTLGEGVVICRYANGRTMRIWVNPAEAIYEMWGAPGEAAPANREGELGD